MARNDTVPDGTERLYDNGTGRKYRHKRINGKWVYQRNHPDGYIDKWGNHRKIGSGDKSPVIGKYGPRPELRQLIYGVGVNDVMIPEFSKTRTYRTWGGMIRRTGKRDPNMHNFDSYKDCNLDPRWYKLSVFKEWIEQWDDYENKEIDKDILIPGNKDYGPDSCLMVRPFVNLWFKPNAAKGDLPRGVSWNPAWRRGKSPNPYRAQITPIGGKRTGLGYYSTVEKASTVFESARKEQLKILIETETDLKVKNALINNLT